MQMTVAYLNTRNITLTLLRKDFSERKESQEHSRDRQEDEFVLWKSCCRKAIWAKVFKVLLNKVPSSRRLYSYILRWETSLCKTPHFQWIYGKLNQIYEKLRSDQMDPKSALGGPKLISRTGMIGSGSDKIVFGIQLCWFACWHSERLANKVLQVFVEQTIWKI